MSGFPGGASVLLAGLLLVAGGLKLLRPKSFTHAVYRLLPRHLTRRETLASSAPWVVAPAELFLGLGLLAAAARPAAWWSAAVIGCVAGLYLGFVGVVVIAIRKGTSCGCFSSFSDGVAGGAELGRALALALLGVALLVSAPFSGAASWWTAGAFGWLPALGAVVILAAALGGRTRPAAWVLLGQVNSRLSGVELPTAISGRERADAIGIARRTPSVASFERWLGSRGADVDWRHCEVRSTSATPPGGRRVPCLLVTPRCGTGLTMTVSVPDAFPDRAVVIAVVDGQPVSAIGDRVLVGARPATQRA